MAISKKLLVTGGRGRVASALHDHLGARGWVVDLCSRTPGSGMRSLDEVLDARGRLGVDAVVHCAWSTVPATAQERPTQSDEVDLPLLQRVIRRIQTDPDPPVCLFMSTGAVYGMAPGRGSRESDEPRPLGDYARGKLAAEQMLAASGVPHCVMRTSNIYSLSFRPHDRQGVIGRLIWTALEGGCFQQWGGGSVKDYLHRDDFARALAAVVERRVTGMVNVASGTATSLANLVELVAQEVGRPLRIESHPAPAWDATDNRLDIELLRSLTGWEPAISLREGLAREVARMSLDRAPQPLG